MAVISRDVPKCPVCGSPAVLFDVDVDGTRKFFIYCLNAEKCGLTSGMCATPDEALKAWDNQKGYAERVHAERRDKA